MVLHCLLLFLPMLLCLVSGCKSYRMCIFLFSFIFPIFYFPSLSQFELIDDDDGDLLYSCCYNVKKILSVI